MAGFPPRCSIRIVPTRPSPRRISALRKRTVPWPLTKIDLAAATVEKTKTLLAYTQIVAPFDGVVARRLVNRGDLVQPPTGTLMRPLFTVQRIDTIRVFCDVPENDVPLVHIGDPAIVKSLGFDGKPFIGKVTRFSLRLDPETRNMRTEIDLLNPEERLYPGMYADVSLEMNRHPDALTVPAAALGSDGDGNFVYTITDNRITRLAVKTGLTDNARIEVTGGLSKETPVVTTFRARRRPERRSARTPNGKLYDAVKGHSCAASHFFCCVQSQGPDVVLDMFISQRYEYNA